MEDRISPVPREARPYQGEPAGLLTRLIANTVDALTVGAVLLVGYACFNGLLFMINPRSFQFSGASFLLSLFTALVVLVCYLTVAWSTMGRTYGDHVMGLRVVGRRGRRLRPWTAFVRAVFCVGFPIGVLWCAGSRSRRSLQDEVLRTSVIYDWTPRRARGDSGHSPEVPTAPPGQPPGTAWRRPKADRFQTTSSPNHSSSSGSPGTGGASSVPF